MPNDVTMKRFRHHNRNLNLFMIDIKENIPLAPLTTFRVGGPAKYLVEVKNAEELGEAFEFARQNSLQTLIFGGGSNVLVSDNGFDGLAIMMKGGQLELDGETITVGAGVLLSELVRFAAENGLSGLEWAVGIPGTVGGAIRGNAGAYSGNIGELVESVWFVDISELDGKTSEMQNANLKMQNTKELNKEECGFEYRSSVFKKNAGLIILSVKLKLQKDDGNEIKEKMQKIVKERVGKIVKGASAGSFFMNPVVSDEKIRNEFRLDTGVEPNSESLPAGWIIEHAGLRGKKIGGAMVSEQHGNFIINTGNATAEDIVMLASIIKQKVRGRYNVQLMEEVSYVGF